MRGRRQFGALAAMLAAALALALAACSGTSGGSGGPPPPLPLVIQTSSLPHALTSAVYSETLQVTGGVSPYTWSLKSGALPPGLTFTSNGVISGTTSSIPNAPANFFFGVQVQDTRGVATSQNLAIEVVDPLGILSSGTLPAGNVAVGYSTALSASGGVAPLHWSLATGSSPLPSGLTLSDSGNIAGTPTASGSFSFTTQVTDSDKSPQQTSGTFSISITNRPVVINTGLPDGVATRVYSQTLQATAGTPPYTWSLVQGTLPNGLSLSAAGVISGTPSQEETQQFFVKVTDSAGQVSDSAGFFLSIQPVLSFFNGSQLPDGVQNISYVNNNLTLQGGLRPYTLQTSSGALPPGLSITTTSDPSGNFQFSGIPTTIGTFTFTFQASDSETPPMTASHSFSIRINSQLVFSPSLPPGLEGQPYNFTLTASGGVPPYQWTSPNLTSQTGLSLNNLTGVISGTPNFTGTQTIEIIALDSSNPQQQALSLANLRIATKLLIVTSSLPPLAPGATVSMTPALSGGTGPFTWNVSSGAFPVGVSLDANTGEISGTTTTVQTSNFALTVNDPGPPTQTATATFTLVVKSSLGRNDTPATATPLSNGTYEASISPFADPPGGPANPDVDVYQLSANPGAVATIETFADRLNPRSPLDSVIEVVDQNGNRLNLCSSTPDFPDGIFQSPCMDDDIISLLTTDSKLFLQVPSGNSGPLTFFVRVLDFRGDARPDLIYKIQISGAN